MHYTYAYNPLIFKTNQHCFRKKCIALDIKGRGFFCNIKHNCCTTFWDINFELIRHLCKLQSKLSFKTSTLGEEFARFSQPVWCGDGAAPAAGAPFLLSWSSPRSSKSFSLCSTCCYQPTPAFQLCGLVGFPPKRYLLRSCVWKMVTVFDNYSLANRWVTWRSFSFPGAWSPAWACGKWKWETSFWGHIQRNTKIYPGFVLALPYNKAGTLLQQKEKLLLYLSCFSN